ncbi:MAG: hypothetical protein M1136_00395 [Chloroflexi bacterium]|nr:hypothetical protein [Chloroflexota bacterium]MCL5074099.1 hypothetical protein [Chloroflexota bacterium]
MRRNASELTPRHRVLCALRHEQPDRIPVDFWANSAVWDNLKRYFGVTRKAEVLEGLEVDCRTIEPCYVGPPVEIVPDAFLNIWGTHRKYARTDYGQMWVFDSYPLGKASTVAEVESYPWPKAEWFDVSDLIEQIRAINGGTGYFIHYRLGSPFETAWALRGLEQTLIDMAEGSEIVAALLNRITDSLIAIGRKVLEAADGLIDAVRTGDDVATQQGLLMSPATWRRYIKPCHVRLNRMIHDYGARVLYHCCGAVYDLIDEFIDMGIDILNPLQPRAAKMDLALIKERYGDRLCFHGGIDVQRTLPFGTVAEVAAEVRERVRVLGKNGGYVMTAAHGIQPDVPLANILSMYDVSLR